MTIDPEAVAQAAERSSIWNDSPPSRPPKWWLTLARCCNIHHPISDGTIKQRSESPATFSAA